MTQNAKTTFLGRNKTRPELWEEHLKGPIVALDKALKCVGELVLTWILARDILWKWPPMACGREGSGMIPEMWKKPLWERVRPYWDPWDSVRLRTASTHWNVPGEVWAAWRALLLASEEGAGGLQ